jgi:PAS domain S-box-containing protein
MEMKSNAAKSNAALHKRIKELERQLDEARDTIEAIRTGQIDALVVSGNNGHALYTLQSADHSYRVFIEKMVEGAVSLNASGLIIYSNSRFASMVGLPLTKVIGTHFREFVAKESTDTYDSIFGQGWSQDIKREIFLSSPGRKVPVQLSVNPLQVDAGSLLNIIITDLTLLKETEGALKDKTLQLERLNNALAKSNDDLQQFASVASHDLQEPLRKIQVFSRFLKDANFEQLPDSAKQFVDKIILSSNRMKALILDILNYSRLSADDQNFEPVDLTALMAEITADFELVIEEKNALIEIGDLPVVEGNRGQLRQVFSNLISNALKFTRANVRPSIVVGSRKIVPGDFGFIAGDEKKYCSIFVKDNGIGFDQKFAFSIFSLFEKLNPKSTFEGSGIGLAIAKKIIDKHQGTIHAKSKANEGSEFNIILPFTPINPNG